MSEDLEGVKGIMYYQNVDESNRKNANDFICSHWFSTDIVIRGKVVDLTTVDGIICYDSTRIVGLITYILADECEILSLDSIIENIGIGTELINQVIDIARDYNCSKVKLITTNDNIHAMKFYQKRGFDMARLYHNALEASRKLKSSIPLKGNYDIPIMHEIEFEMLLN